VADAIYLVSENNSVEAEAIMETIIKMKLQIIET
jgi:hypothetical protein